MCRQDTKGVEVVVADNASRDDSLSVLERLQKKHRFKILRHPKNMGALGALNHFLLGCRSSHILLLAADDKLLPSSLGKISKMMARYPAAGFILWNLLELDARGRTSLLAYRYPSNQEYLSGSEFRRFFGGQPVIGQAAFSVPHLQSMGGIPEALRWHADHYVCHALGIRHGMVFSDEPLGIFRRLPQSMGSGMEGPEEGVVLQEFVRLLSLPENRDLQTGMKECMGLSIFGSWLRRELPKTPEGLFFWDAHLRHWLWAKEVRSFWRHPIPPWAKHHLRLWFAKLAGVKFKEHFWSPVRRQVLGFFRWASKGLGQAAGIPLDWVASSPAYLGREPEEGVLLLQSEKILADIPPTQIQIPQPHPNLAGGLGGGRYSVWLADLPEAEVIGPSIAVVTRKKVLLGDVSVEWGRTSDDHGVMRRFRLPPAISLEGTSILLATTGGDTYYHWMMEVLPRLLLLQEAGINLSRVDHFLVNGFQKRFQMESLEAVGIPVTKCRTTQGKCRYRCEQLLVPSLLGPHGWAQPDACQFLKKLFPGSGTRKDGKRIFVPRGQTQGRKVRREDEILALLAEFKFESFDAGKVSLREQAETFACAEMVVGIHGGALTNLAFCTPGTRVVEIFGWRYVNPCYRSLASAVGAEHYAVLDMPERRGPAITSFTSSSSDLEGNVEGLREMLEILV